MTDLVKIIAGPCSVDFQNKHEIIESLGIKLNGKSALYGVRVVGLKSRTNFDPKNAFIGIDIENYNENCEIMMRAGAIKNMPSVEIANEIQAISPNTFIATEIIDQWVQPAVLAKFLRSKNAIIWNPAVNHLGFPMQVMARFAKQNGWKVGIKNGKTLGSSLEKSEVQNQQTSLDKSWAGLASYADILHESDVFFIHRGVDLGDNQGFRNYPVHNLCSRVKNAINQEIFLDPSHIAGPKKRDEIVDFTVDAMKIKDVNGSYLYTGILLECGTAKSDTEQHISHAELEQIIAEVTKFRKLG